MSEIFATYHFDGAVLRIEGEQVLPDQIGLVVMPVDDEGVTFLLGDRHIRLLVGRVGLRHHLGH